VSQPIIQVTTHPFGLCGSRPRNLLNNSPFEVRYNPYRRRLKPSEVAPLVREAHGILAGTEPYTREILEEAHNLRVISRVGAGLDNIDVATCRQRGIVVTFTPLAPSDAVAELTVANIVSLLRHVHRSDHSVREQAWNRFLGMLVREVKIGILGVGRIGKRVVKLLEAFQPQLYGCDIEPDLDFGRKYGITWLSREELFATCDLVSVHVPLREDTRYLVGAAELRAMKPGGYLVNTARGKIVDESALVEALSDKHLGGAAIDVFEHEPYEGPLAAFDNVILTAHIGGSAHESRYLMELGAAEDCLRVLSGLAPKHPATDADFGLRASPKSAPSSVGQPEVAQSSASRPVYGAS